MSIVGPESVRMSPGDDSIPGLVFGIRVDPGWIVSGTYSGMVTVGIFTLMMSGQIFNWKLTFYQP